MRRRLGGIHRPAAVALAVLLAACDGVPRADAGRDDVSGVGGLPLSA